MPVADILFYLFASITVLAAGLVITARNPMYSVLGLIVAFFNVGGLFIILGAEFLGLLLLMVYVGAVAVMFLFVLLTININYEVLKDGFTRYAPAGVVVGALVLVEIVLAVWLGIHNMPAPAFVSLPTGEAQNIEAIGQVLFTNYLLPFQMSALILLVAMIGAIVLTHRTREGVRRQNIGQQVLRQRKDSVYLAKPQSGKGVK